MLKSKNKFFVSFDDVNFLFQELQNAWTAGEIPSFHQEIFKSHLDFIDPAQVPHVIAQEINQVESLSSPVQNTLASITKREFLIGKLTTFKQKTRNFSSKDLEIIESTVPTWCLDLDVNQLSSNTPQTNSTALRFTSSLTVM